MSGSRLACSMGRLLRAGVLAASVCVLAGGVLLLRSHAPVSYRAFTPETLRSSPALRTALVHGDPSALVLLGVLVLVATPVARVAFAALAVAGARGWVYVAVSLLVLSVVLFGFLRVT